MPVWSTRSGLQVLILPIANSKNQFKDSIMYFATYEIHLGEEGWYVYKQPENKAVRAIRYYGPLTKDEADRIVESKNSTKN